MEGIITEHDAIKHEVGLLRQLAEKSGAVREEDFGGGVGGVPMKMMRVYARLSRISWRASKRGDEEQMAMRQQQPWQEEEEGDDEEEQEEMRRRRADLARPRIGDDHPSPNARRRRRTTPTTTQLT